MSRKEVIRGCMASALAQLDASFGRYRSGMVIAGNRVPGYKDAVDREDPLRLTRRVMVDPVMDALGYGHVNTYDILGGEVPGVSLAVVNMNSDLQSAISRMLSAMATDGAETGMATDGFRWAVARRNDGKVRISSMCDLRPYYIEFLDRDRFRAAEPEDEAEMVRFVRTFSNRRTE